MADGFKIADGYVEVHGVSDRRSVIMAADQITRGVSDQMTTGVAFGNLREGGRKMGAVLGEHAGPSAARETTEGIADHIDGGGSAGSIDRAGQSLGRLLGRSGGSPFVQHLIDEINRNAQISTPGGGTDGTNGGDGRTGAPGSGGDAGTNPRGRAGAGGNGGDGSGGRGRAGADGSNGEANRRGRTIGEQLGEGAVSGFMSAFTQGIRSPLSLLTANPIIGTAAIAIGAGLAALAAPAFAAAFAAALIGGAGLGVIGLGAFLLKDDPEVRAAAGKLAATAKSVFQGSAKPLVEPFVNSFAILENLLVKIAPDLTEMFTAIAPAIVPLTRGFAGFVEGALPGFLELIKAATPFLMDLEHTLPRFGEHVGTFLAVIADAGPAATAFFRDFLNLLGILLMAFGHFVNVLSGMYQGTRTIILFMVDVFVLLYKGIKANIDLVIAIFQGWYNIVRDVFFKARRDSDGFVGFLRALPGKVWEAIKTVPDRVRGVFADAGEWLKRAGERIIAGLIRGIRNAIPGLDGLLSGIAQRVRDYWPFSPAKIGPLSGQGALDHAGENLMADLAKGMQKGISHIDRASTEAATLPVPTAPTVSTDMGGITINIHTTISSWSEVPDATIAALDAALNRYRKAYA